MQIEIIGRTPSKKNSKQMFVNKGTGQRYLVPSKQHGEWHKHASLQIASWKNKQTVAVRHNLPIRKQVEMTIYFYPPDSKKGDLTNKAESIMDLLVDNRILEDDNWDCVPALTLCFGGIDRVNPRAEIHITVVD